MSIHSCIDLRVANVYGIYGHLGGGKTLTAVDIAVNVFLRRGWRVVSNIALRNLPVDQQRQYQFIDDFSAIDFWSLPCGAPRGSSSPVRSAIIIDECAEFFDQYTINTPFIKSFLSWLRHSSKRGQFVFLIVQRPEFISKSLRLLIHKWIVCDDMYQLRLPILRIHIPFCEDLVIRRCFDRNGNRISSGLSPCSKSLVGRYYDTSQSIALSGRDNNFDNFQFERPYPYISLVNFILLLYLFYLFNYY